jgi:hypothetical protein
MFVDVGRVGRSSLDFTPEADEVRSVEGLSSPALAAWAVFGRQPAALPPSATREMAWAVLAHRFTRRHQPIVSRDVGYRIYRQFAGESRHECVDLSSTMFGLFGVQELPDDWEQFGWHGVPFGFHVRGMFHKKVLAEELERLARVVGQCLPPSHAASLNVGG